jgi:hypothetical protein
MFALDAPLTRPAAASTGAEARVLARVQETMHTLEQAVQVTTFSCKGCGDCSLLPATFRRGLLPRDALRQIPFQRDSGRR